MNYSESIQTIAQNLLQHFDQVYHSAELISNDSAEKLPAVALADEWLDLSPSDKHETLYIRRSGDDEVLEELRLGSCSKSYVMRSQLRIVYFRDRAKKHEEIIFNLMQAVLIMNTKLKSVIRDKWKLAKEESSGNYNFGATTAYFAIDIYVLWDLAPDDCEHDFCLDIANPLKKEKCPVVA